VTIATDIIVGFPSETKEDFEKTLNLIKETEPDIVNSSKYSARPKTPASELRQLNSQVIKERTRKLHFLIEQVSRKRNSIWDGWKGDLIIDHVDNKSIEGRNYAYKSVLVCSAGLHQCSLTPQGNSLLGSKVKVRIVGYSNNSLKGILID
jgi:tRNA A37 methylthiotransferase MiaB